MDFALSEEQCLIRDSFRSALRELVNIDRVRGAVEADHHVDTGLWASLSGMGMPGLMIAEEFGGAGLGLLEAVVVAEELGRAAAPVPFAATVVMVPLALSNTLDSTAQQTWLPGLAGGDTRMGLAISEAAAGRRRGQGIAVTDGKLSGETPFALDASGATALMICDQDGGLHLVSCDAPGIEFRAFESIDGTRSIADLTMKHVPATPLTIGNGGTLQRVIDAGRIVHAADSLGAGEEMLSRAVAYAQERHQFGRAIGSFQSIKHMCAEMAAELELCRGLLWYAAYAFDHRLEDATDAARDAKSHIDEVGRFVARTATEVHGGMGFADLTGLHFWFKRIGFNRAALGGPARLREEMALALTE